MLDTGDDDEDMRLQTIIDREIKTAKTHDDLQKLYNEHAETFDDVHRETFSAALNAQDEDLANGA